MGNLRHWLGVLVVAVLVFAVGLVVPPSLGDPLRLLGIVLAVIALVMLAVELLRPQRNRSSGA